MISNVKHFFAAVRPICCVSGLRLLVAVIACIKSPELGPWHYAGFLVWKGSLSVSQGNRLRVAVFRKDDDDRSWEML